MHCYQKKTSKIKLQHFICEIFKYLLPYPSFLWILSLFVSLSLYIMTLFFSGDPKKRKKRKLHHIGFAVYEVPPHMTRLTPLYVAEHVSWCCKQILFSQLAQERIRMVWSKISNLRSSKAVYHNEISNFHNFFPQKHWSSDIRVNFKCHYFFNGFQLVLFLIFFCMA